LPDIRRWKEQFLTVSAFLDYKSISSSIFQELFQRVLDERPDWIRLFDSGKGLYFSDLKFSDIIAELSDLSLVHSIRYHTIHTGYTQTYSLHPLVSDWLKLRISKEDRSTFTFQATSIIENFLAARVVGLKGRYYGFPFKISGDLGPQILAHMQECEKNIRLYLNPAETLGVAALEGAGGWFAGYYQDRGRYLDALTLYDRMHKVKEAALGAHEPSVLRSAANLASLYRLQGNYEQAEQQIRTVLAMQKKVLGDEHVDSLATATILGGILWDQGIFEEAEDVSKKALQLKMIVLGKEDPSTMISLSNLALIIHAQGKLQEAEALNRQTLSLRRKVLGESHPDTLHSYNHLIVILCTLGQFEEAEGLARENLRIRRDTFGDRHPNTATSLGNLALTLQGQGRYAEAEEIFRQAMEIRLLILEPPFHPHILGGMEDLASILVEQGKLSEAQEVQSELSRLSALACEKVLPKCNSPHATTRPKTLPESDSPRALACQNKSTKRPIRLESVHTPTYDIRRRAEYDNGRWK
jgi:tetratricopeptide (TPR) repeat protein